MDFVSFLTQSLFALARKKYTNLGKKNLYAFPCLSFLTPLDSLSLGQSPLWSPCSTSCTHSFSDSDLCSQSPPAHVSFVSVFSDPPSLWLLKASINSWVSFFLMLGISHFLSPLQRNLVKLVSLSFSQPIVPKCLHLNK